jgi:hypothetical protein
MSANVRERLWTIAGGAGTEKLCDPRNSLSGSVVGGGPLLAERRGRGTGPRGEGSIMRATSGSKKRQRVLAAGAFLTLAAVATLVVLTRNKQAAQGPSQLSGHGQVISVQTSQPQLDAEEMKAALLSLHPGMAAEEIFQEPPVDVMQLSLEERQARLEKGLEEHAHEGRDDEWAPRQESRLGHEFSMLRDSFIQLTKVECRSSLCVVTVSWDDAQDGKAAYEGIVTTPLGTGCRLEMVPPAEGSTEARILMDCAEVRSRPEAVSMVATREALGASRPERAQALHGGRP